MFTGVTFDPTAAVTGNAATPTAKMGAQTGSGVADNLPAHAAATSTVASSTTSKINVGTVAGGTVAGVAGLALVGALAFYCLRRRSNNANRKRRTGAAYFE